ncbi:MAG TPA: hypothetical protein VHV55_02180 [Pirellulales bacterium]|jgi:hypothetical protein|nr:hypothetical protein [Pirellulales bacterium]
MSALWKFLVLPVVMTAGLTLATAQTAQAQYGYYPAPAYGYAAPAPYAYGAPYGGYYPPPYYGGGYYARPTIGLSIGIPFGGYGGYRPYYHHGRRW